jgi:ABC-type nitrate/sulfonate/bicarbonate transport system ATPase subunit
LQTAFIVEHDFIMAAYLADRVVVYDGVPSSEATAHCPQSLLTGALTPVDGARQHDHCRSNHASAASCGLHCSQVFWAALSEHSTLILSTIT